MRTLTKQSSIFSLFSRFKLEFLLSNSSLGVAGIAPLSRGLTCQLKFPAVFSLKKCETHMGTKCHKLRKMLAFVDFLKMLEIFSYQKMEADFYAQRDILKRKVFFKTH